MNLVRKVFVLDQEHFVATLCTLYDIKGGYAGKESKNQLANYINACAPDDFDLKSALQP